MKMSAFAMTREIYFQLPFFSVALYHCPLPSLEVRSIDFVSNGSIATEPLGVDTGRTAETAVAKAVVMAPVRAVRNAASNALVIARTAALSLLPVFVAALSGAFLFARLSIVQTL